MRKKNCNCEYLPQRNANLFREFKKRLGNGHDHVNQIFNELAKAPADRFYISEDRACLLVRIFAGLNPDVSPDRVRQLKNRMFPNKVAMIEEIKMRVEELRGHNPDISFKDAVYMVVNSSAPSFFLTPNTIRMLIYNYLRA